MTISAMPAAAAQVLGAARERRRVADRAEAELLELAVQWAVIHPVESLEDGAATYSSRAMGNTEVALAGPGAPLVAEFAVMEFASALGLSTESGKHLIGQALELRYRLPKLWARVTAGALVGWRGRRIAQQTMNLTPEAAGFVDTHVSPVAQKIRPAEIDRLVDEAILRFMPEVEIEAMRDSWEERHVTVDRDQVSLSGTLDVAMTLDLADALDFDAAVAAGADQLAALGSTDTLDVRRATAVGEMSRDQLTLDLTTPDPAASGATKAPRARREVVLYVHLSEAAIRTGLSDRAGDFQLGRVENGGHVVTADQVRSWCGVPGTRVVVKPVIDLHDRVRVDQYEVPDRIAEHVQLRDGTCVFPWCTRPARRCDLDHIVPAARDGETATDNLAPLCRRHHRVKTHGGWTYTPIEPGTYLWTTPNGYHYLRDHTGTTDVNSDRSLVERSRGAPPDP